MGISIVNDCLIISDDIVFLKDGNFKNQSFKKVILSSNIKVISKECFRRNHTTYRCKANRRVGI